MSFYPDVEKSYPDHLRDESRRAGQAETISFPRDEQEIVAHLSAIRRKGRKVTVQGARTGIVAGAVPVGGHILSLNRMNSFLAYREEPGKREAFLTVQPGALLSDVRSEAAGKGYIFPPDPTEETASIGGMVAANSSGARTFHYGPTRMYINRLRVVLARGDILDLKRGDDRASGLHFAVNTDSGRKIEGDLPAYRMPGVKNAAGYYVKSDMDLIDLFIGSEGTLGVVSEIELLLLPVPGSLWGIMTFFGGEDDAISFVKKVRSRDKKPIAIEFFDHNSLDLLRAAKKEGSSFGHLPEIPEAWHTAVYIEYQGRDEGYLEDAIEDMIDLMRQCGSSEDAAWMATDEKEMKRLKDMRHAVPEAGNLMIDELRKKDPGIVKLSTDMAVPDAYLDDMMSMYHGDLDGSSYNYLMFGHIGNNHLHVNVFPRNAEEYRNAQGMCLRWVKSIVEMGGTISAEHGIGKIKTAYLCEMYGPDGVEEMKRIKRLFDPEGMINPGNLF